MKSRADLIGMGTHCKSCVLTVSMDSLLHNWINDAKCAVLMVRVADLEMVKLERSEPGRVDNEVQANTMWR